MNQPIAELRPDFSSLTEAMLHWSAQTSSAPALTFLTGADATTLNYAALHERALAIAGELRAHCDPGDRVIMGYEQGTEYVAGFLACVYAGAVAVTSSPPTELRRSSRLERLIADSGAAAILTDDEAQAAFGQIDGNIALINSNHMTTGPLSAPAAAQPDDLMLLQYTSGSTSAPKGVMLTHASITANLRAIIADTRPDAESVYVSWLPLYHDMGLIFMTLAPLFAGRPVYLMSPSEFLRRPERWLQAISTWRGTITAAPNFAYRLCAERIRGETTRALDLSAMRLFVNGSEPIRIEDMEAFLEAFEANGLRREAMTGGYGMAELGVYACLGPAFATDTYFDAAQLTGAGEARAVAPGPVARRLAACGSPNPDHFDLRIVDPVSQSERPDGATGEIWIAGPSVGRGYWRNAEATGSSFGASSPGAPDGFGQAGYLRTGDIGFKHQGQLFISGRSKEMMILRGRNVFPADVCEIVEQIGPAMRGRRAAAFTVPGEPDEQLVIVCAARAPNPEAGQSVARRIVSAVSRELGVIAHDVVIVPNRALSRTTSGKVQHGALRQAYLEDAIEADFSLLRGQIRSGEKNAGAGNRGASAHDAGPPAPDWIVQRICGYVSDISGQPQVRADGDLFELGFDSLRGMRLIERIESDLLRGASRLSLADLSEMRTPRSIAAALGAQAARNSQAKELVL